MNDFDTQSEAFLAEIEAELEEGDLSFPTVLDLSLRIKQAAEDPNTTVEQIAALIRIEPLLAARVLHIANSVIFNPMAKPASSVIEAIPRIGLSNVRVMALFVAIEQIAQEYRSPQMQSLAWKVWQHSVDVAAWASALAHHLGIGRPDTPLLAGLMIDIGQLFLIARVVRYPALATDIPRFSQLVAMWHAPLACAILESMDLPTDLVDALDYENPYGGSWPPKTLSEVLFVAGLATEFDNPFDPLNGENRRRLLDLAKLQLEAPKFEQLLAEALAGRNELLAVLKG
ncbi:MAG: HDOD domain-containing protein [Betaproteobacteria bacterium]